MGKSQESFSKKEKEKKRLKKREDKKKKKEERKSNSVGGNFEDMIAYVDEYGNTTTTPPDPSQKIEIDLEDIQISTPKNTEIEDPVRTGIVEFFNQDKGFGFIKDLGSGEKYFVHINNVPGGAIKEGNKVTFELERGKKGMDAVRVNMA